MRQNNVKYLSLPQQVEENRKNIQKLLTEYSQVFTTQLAIQGQSSLLIANLTNIEHKPVVGDLIYGSDSYYAQITRVGESVVEFIVIGPISNLDSLYLYLNNQLLLKANVQQEAWITPTLLNGATGTIQYRKTQWGRIEFRGTLIVAQNAVSQFQLADGYRPLGNFISMNVITTTDTQITFVIYPTGIVETYGVGIGTITTNYISFVE